MGLKIQGRRIAQLLFIIEGDYRNAYKLIILVRNMLEDIAYENSSDNKIYSPVLKMRKDGEKLSHFDELKYNSLQGDLDEMNELFDKFHEYYSQVIIKGKMLGLSEQEKEEGITKISVSIDKIIHKHRDMLESYQEKLNKTTAIYLLEMEKLSSEFYKPVVENFSTDNPDVKKFADSEGTLSEALLSVAKSKEVNDSQRAVLKRYEEVLNQARNLYDACEDTDLNSRGLLSVLMKYGTYDVENDMPGGKRGELLMHHYLTNN